MMDVVLLDVLEWEMHSTWVIKWFHKSKSNNRAKCLAISQVARAKLYNGGLLFVYKKLFLLLVLHSLTLSFLILLTFI